MSNYLIIYVLKNKLQAQVKTQWIFNKQLLNESITIYYYVLVNYQQAQKSNITK